MMKFKVEKIVFYEKAAYKVLDFKLLKKDQLPSTYLESDCYVYLSKDGYLQFGPKTPLEDFKPGLKVGDIVLVETFKKVLRHLKKAGENLKQINKDLATLKQEWQGTETYII